MDNGQFKQNVLKDKSYGFALRIIKLYKYLSVELREYVLSKQILRCGTSVGANIAEANQAQSKPDFISKLSIALKEAVERNIGCAYCETAIILRSSKQKHSLQIAESSNEF